MVFKEFLRAFASSREKKEVLWFAAFSPAVTIPVTRG
jgi:hypothetical protein